MEARGVSARAERGLQSARGGSWVEHGAVIEQHGASRLCGQEASSLSTAAQVSVQEQQQKRDSVRVFVHFPFPSIV